MKVSRISKSDNKRDIIARILIVAACIVLVIWALPRNEKQTFRYNVGKPWMYGSFIAKFDFPIYKTDEVLRHERDSILQAFQPYYTLKPEVEERMIEKLEADFPDGFPGLGADYLRIVVNRLHRIYQARVMDTGEFNELSKDRAAMLRIIDGKEVDSRNIGYIYSTRNAYEQLFIDEELGNAGEALRRCNLNEYIEPNIVYDRRRTEVERDELINSIPVADGMVMTGQKIIDRGDIVDEATARILASFEKENSNSTLGKIAIRYTLFGHILQVTLLVLLFTCYLYLYRRDYFDKPRSMLMPYVFIAVFPMLTSFVIAHSILSVYILPFSIAPMFVRIFMDSRTAFFTHVVTVLLAAMAVTYQYEFIIIQIVAGVVAIFSLRELSKRSQVFRTATFVCLASILIYYALQLIQSDDDMKLDADMYFHFIANGALTLLAYPLMYVVEKLFNFTSDVVLFELSNTSRGLLRRLSEVAPGTFQHSVSVANLATEVANKIGANSLLVHTGALYHDIGKMENPVFFTENQQHNNPHENMTYKQSAQIIIGHVAQGVALAEKQGLPRYITDFILTHHGRGKAKYFYIMEKNSRAGEEVDEGAFTYPGPNPFTKEQAVLMMADASEAAARSLTEYTEESITALIDRIIDSQVADGYFKECPITFRDIQTAKKVIIERLMNIYHTRISYPEMKTNETTPHTGETNRRKRRKK
ncbi:MAG: HDIG domain-containing protein [Prevotella sp.]|nr:HDIG domain-containing protein [Prevotella sp.]